MDGLQTDPTLCDTVVGGIVVTPTPTPAPGPTQVLGTQVTRSQPLPTTGADTRGLAAAGVALILAGAAIAATGYRKDTVPET